jgi:hypothetical protein
MSLARKLLATGAGLAALAAFAVPALAGTVIASSGPSAAQYRVGAQIANTQRITLRSGDSVTVLDNGGTRIFSGPGTYVLARRSGQAENRAFAALTTQRSADRARIASVRGEGGAQVTNPSLWYVDIARSGTVCLADPARVRMWRGDPVAEATYEITAPGMDASRVTFPASEGIAAWGATTPPSEGVTYTIGTSEVTFKFLTEVPEEPEAMAQELLAQGCTMQVEQLAAATLEEAA